MDKGFYPSISIFEFCFMIDRVREVGSPCVEICSQSKIVKKVEYKWYSWQIDSSSLDKLVQTQLATKVFHHWSNKFYGLY